MEAQTHIRRLVQFSLILLGAVLVCPLPAMAEFLLTKAAGVYEESRGTVKVIVASTPEEQGIFVIVGPPLAPQEFSLNAWVDPRVDSVYIRFNQRTAQPHYTEVITSTHWYRVDGNLSLQLGPHTTIGIDNNNPYLTVEFNDSPDLKGAALLGFSGVNEIVQEHGEKVPLVSASTSDDGGLLYTLKGGRLYEGVTEVTANTIGRFIRLKNECLNPESVALNGKDVRRLQEIANEHERARVLKELFDNARARPALRDYLILSAEPAQVILLDYRTKSVHRMTASVPKGLNQRICVITDVAVGALK